MNPFSSASIRIRFLVLILAVLTPTLALILYGAQRERAHRVDDAEKEVIALARLASLEEVRLLEEARALLMGLAMIWESEGEHPDECQTMLDRVLASNHHYRNFGIVDRDGGLRCSALPLRRGLDLSDRLYIRRAIEQKGFAVGGYEVGRVSGEQTINFGYPILDEAGEVRSVVYGALGLTALERVAGHMSPLLPPEALLTKIDNNGIVLSRSPGGENWVGREAPEYAAIRDLVSKGPGCIRGPDSIGEPALMSFAPVRSRMWAGDVYVVLCVPERTVFAGLAGDLRQKLLLLALTAILTLIIALWLSHVVVVKPLRDLVGATSSLRHGDLSARVGPRYGGGELGILGRAFDEMAKTLQERQREREESATALVESEREYRSLWERAPYGVMRVDEAGRILMANPAMANMLGYDSEQELVSLRLDRDVLSNPDDHGAVLARHAHDETLAGVNMTWRRKDGGLVQVGLSGRRVRDAARRTVFFEIFAENETERRTLEEQLRQAQKMEAVGRLAGGVAHDFNNLLGVMLGYSNMALQELSPDDPNYESLNEIRQATEKAAALTQQLLFISRRQVMEPRILDLNQIVSELESMLKSLAGESVDLKLRAGADLAPVRADPGQMEQVLLNLVVNARDAMPGGGKVTLTTENVELAAPISGEGGRVEPGRYVRLTVADTGVGMDRETLVRVFEPFFTTKEKDKGTGLGLSTVQAIVERSGGAMRVTSRLGRGAKFEVYLPVTAERPERRESPGVPVARPQMGPETILLVEDEASLRTMTRRFLEGEGYRVLEANSCTHALDLAQRHQGTIHLVLTDVVMPRMSGREVADRVRTLRPDAQVLFVSGYADDVLGDQGVLKEGEAFLAKPFAPEALLAKVREVVGAS